MEKTIESLLNLNGYNCNANVRIAIAKAVGGIYVADKAHPTLKNWANVIEYAIEVGGAKHGSNYEYRNAQGGVSVARVFDLYEIPENLTNPMLVCFSGYVPAAFYALEANRAYKVKYGRILPIFATGKGGNKGLFEDVFNTDEGIMVGSEAEMYMRILEHFTGPRVARQNQRAVADMDTKGNFNEMYQLAKAKGLSEITLVLCSGQPWYTKRLLAEGMLEFGKPKYADVKINLIVLDCPFKIMMNLVGGDVSEILLGYIAASLGPLTKDTTPLRLDGKPDFSKERYLLPGVVEADWSKFEELITHYSNMGWPNYQELLYGIDHKTAVCNIILADLRARHSFSKKSYEMAIRSEIARYESFLHNSNLNACTERNKYFPRIVALKLNWHDGYDYRTKYVRVPYLKYKVDDFYKIWDMDYNIPEKF